MAGAPPAPEPHPNPPPPGSCCESLFSTAEPFTPEGLSVDFVNRLRAGTLWAQSAAHPVHLAALSRNQPHLGAQNAIKIVLFLNYFSDAIFERFGEGLGRQLGVIFVLFGAQVQPNPAQNVFRKPIDIKNVNFHQTLRLPIPERFLSPHDGAQNRLKSAQGGSETVSEGHLFDLKNRINFGHVLGPMLDHLGSKIRPGPLQIAPRGSKRHSRPPKTPQRHP